MDTRTEIKKVYDVVKGILAKDERARNCDKYLTFRVIEWFLYATQWRTGFVLALDQLNELPAFETVKRVRAKIQNKEGLYLPTDEKVRDKRRKRQKQMSELFG